MVNALERAEQLEMRKRQGELIGKPVEDQILAALTVATGAVLQSVRDANLMAGVDAVISLGEGIADPEKNEAYFIKFMGEKLPLWFPTRCTRSPRPVPQLLMTRRHSGRWSSRAFSLGLPWEAMARLCRKSYDVLGNVRQINDTGALWNIFSQSTEEERKKGRSEVELDVLRKLDHISKQTGTSFVTPYTHRDLGTVDLRTQMTGDGKETLYDRWNRYYKELRPEEGLSVILNSGLPIGTASIDGAAVTEAKAFISDMREAAFSRLLAGNRG